MPTQPLPIDLTKLLAPYKGQWVALSPDEKHVLSHGDDISQILAEAEKKLSEGERPFLVKVPDGNGGFVLI